MSARSFFRSAALLAALVLAASGCEKSHDRIVVPEPPPLLPPGLNNDEAILSLATTDSAVIAAVTIGTVRSVDGGATWSLVDRTPLAMLASIGEHVFANSYDGIAASDDGGLVWRRLPPATLPVGFTYYLVSGGSALLASGSYAGVYRSTDFGAHWDPASPAPSGSISSLAAEGAKAVGLGPTGPYVSVDGGASWAPTAAVPPGNESVLTVAVSGGRLYAGTYKLGIFSSDDDGATWTRTPADPSDEARLVRLFAAEGDLYAMTIHGLFRSRDGGSSWTPMTFDEPIYTNQIVAHSGSLFATTQSIGVLRSDDDGASWSRVHATGGGPIVISVDGRPQARSGAIP